MVQIIGLVLKITCGLHINLEIAAQKREVIDI
jgi:hypothetical protein